MITGIQDICCRQTITAREYRLARITSEDKARADRLCFEVNIKALIATSPQESEPVHLLDQGVDRAIMTHGHAPSPLALPVGQYYPAPPRETATVAYRPQSHMLPDVTMYPVPEVHCYESPFLDPPNKFSHGSKFKTALEGSVKFKNNTIVSLETFVDGSKASLDVTVCEHYYFAPYIEWKVD
jgi:hypothetical protein